MLRLGRSVVGRRWSSTLTYLETTANGQIAPSSLSALNAAAKLKQPITAFIVGSNALDASKSLQSLKPVGLKSIMCVTDAKFDHHTPEFIAPGLAKLMETQDFSHFVVASSAVGKNLIPRVAVHMDIQPVCDVTSIIDSKTFARPTYAGNIMATVQSEQPKQFISIRASAFGDAPEGAQEQEVTVQEIELAVDANARAATWVSANLLESSRPDLASAKVVVSGGRALKDKEHFDQIINPLAEKLNAAIGATRAAVDSGFCDNSLQVGQTGKVIAPDLYIALGISGAIQHVAGMKNSKVIVAINSDPDAPIFKIADYGIVGDVFQLTPELVSKLK